MLSEAVGEAETSPGKIPLGCNYGIATRSNRRKGRFREIHSTSLRFARYDIFAEISFTFFLNKLSFIIKIYKEISIRIDFFVT